jgi:hypothetical protein
MFAGDGRADRLLHNLPGWVKAIGPVECAVALNVRSALQEFFQKNNVEVLCEAIAD